MLMLVQVKEAKSYSHVSPNMEAPFEPPYRLDSSVWVGNRLSEFIPVPLRARQKLMELQDAHARLELVQRFLVQHGVLA